MAFDMTSYIMGAEAEKSKGVVVIEGDIVAIDDGEGNITITTEVANG